MNTTKQTTRETPQQTAQQTADEQDWRGVAADGQEVSDHVGAMLQARSRRLLGDLIRPHKRWIWVLTRSRWVAAKGPSYDSWCSINWSWCVACMPAATRCRSAARTCSI